MMIFFAVIVRQIAHFSNLLFVFSVFLYLSDSSDYSWISFVTILRIPQGVQRIMGNNNTMITKTMMMMRMKWMSEWVKMMGVFRTCNRLNQVKIRIDLWSGEYRLVCIVLRTSIMCCCTAELKLLIFLLFWAWECSSIRRTNSCMMKKFFFFISKIFFHFRNFLPCAWASHRENEKNILRFALTCYKFARHLFFIQLTSAPRDYYMKLEHWINVYKKN